VTTTYPSPAPHRHRRDLASSLAAVAAVAAIVTGCTATSSAGSGTGPSRAIGPPSPPAPTVTAIVQPSGGRAGPEVTVTGTAYWVQAGHPGCSMLDIQHSGHHQIVELVGPPVAPRKQAAQRGETPATQAVTVTGFVPAATASACGDAMAFTVTKVTPVIQ
jgi:hypothetical protein